MTSDVTTVNVVGLGYVGVEVCLAAVKAGHTVSGIDSDKAKVEAFLSPAPAGHDEWCSIRKACRDGLLSVHVSAAAAPSANVWIVAVPTPLDHQNKPDLSSIRAAAATVASLVPRGATVILESTSFPGTTEKVFMVPFLEAGLIPGEDVFIGFSPERINPAGGWPMRSIPKIVAGVTPACLEAVIAFYETVVEHIVPMSSVRAAEFAKLYENAWRLINVAFANEIETLCEASGIDPWEVFEACSTKPFGFVGFVPGPGAGGHCIPVDASYLSHFAAGQFTDVPLLDAALAANRSRPREIARRIVERLGPSASRRVLLIGVAYKADVADIRESSALAVLHELEAQGVHVEFHDALIASVNTASGKHLSMELTDETVATFDTVAVLCAHSCTDWSVLERTNVPIFDLCNIVSRIEPGISRP